MPPTDLAHNLDLSGSELQIRYPSGQPFLSYVEIAQRAEQAEQRVQDAIPRLLGMGLSVEQIAEALGLSSEAVQQNIQD
jgi:DNA-binding NarL/FixJ family response regulator